MIPRGGSHYPWGAGMGLVGESMGNKRGWEGEGMGIWICK